MWYFAYGLEASKQQMASASRAAGSRVAVPRSRGVAILRNYCLCFPTFDEAQGGGLCSIMPAAAKWVAGALYSVGPQALAWLDERYAGFRRVEVTIGTDNAREPIVAVTHQARPGFGDHYPPSPDYLDALISAACERGHSWLWIEYLRSFGTTEGSCRVAV